jgi:hypothetical protein
METSSRKAKAALAMCAGSAFLAGLIAIGHLFATLCLAASPVQAQPVVTESRTATSQDEENSPRLTIRVHRIAPLSIGTLVSAEAEAARILRSTHLRLTWVNCPAPTTSASCAVPEQPSSLSLRVFTNAFPQAPTNALGMVAASPYGNCAFLFYDRIVACHTFRGLIFQVLGRVIAHEIVHLLLPSSCHSASGLMTARWFTEDLQFDRQSDLRLSTRWIELIREEALRRERATKTPLNR